MAPLAATYRPLLLLLLLVGSTVCMDAQVEPRRGTLDSAYWQELVEPLDYEALEEPVEREEEPMSTDRSDFWGPFFKVLAIILAVVILVVIFRQMLSDNPFWSPSNRKFNRGVEVTLDNIEEHLEEVDLNDFIREATGKGDFSQAIRLYYLAIIKALSEQSLIQWKKDKTNQDYQRELRGAVHADRFAEATRHFERVWYGKYLIDSATFERLQPFFRDFYNQIQNEPIARR